MARAHRATASAVARALRAHSGLSQRGFAAIVGTSGPTIAAYESEAKEPRVSTLERMANALDLDLDVVASPSGRAARLRARRRRRSLAVAAATAAEVALDPAHAIALAEGNLVRMEGVVKDNRSRERIAAWRDVIKSGPNAIRATLLDPRESFDDLRQMQPFAGLLSEPARQAALAVADADTTTFIR